MEQDQKKHHMITHDDDSTAVLSEGRELLSVCGHLHSAYGTGIVVLREGERKRRTLHMEGRREGRREEGRKGERDREKRKGS